MSLGLNPLSQHFATICVSDLILVSEEGEVVIGDEPFNAAAFAVHSAVSSGFFSNDPPSWASRSERSWIWDCS
jgi:hypothetical protein